LRRWGQIPSFVATKPILQLQRALQTLTDEPKYPVPEQKNVLGQIKHQICHHNTLQIYMLLATDHQNVQTAKKENTV
jgi:hypothetical protein